MVDLIFFVCGNNVCKKHLDELLKNIPKETTNFECEIYNNEHSIRTKSFVINKRMQQGLEIEFITFELTTVYDECKVDIQKANKNVEKIESLRKNSESYIYEYFEDLIDMLIFENKISRKRLINTLTNQFNRL